MLQAGTSKVAYASALCRVAELAQSKPGGLSLAATGTSSAELLIRVRNILGQPPIQPATTWRWPLILAAIPIGILVTTAMVWISEGNWKTNLPVQKPAVASDGAQDEVQDAGKAESKDFSIRVVDQDGNPVKDASAELTLWNRRGQVMWPKPKPTTNDGTLAFQNSGKLRHLADMVLILANDSDKSHASLMIFKDEEIDRLQYDGTLTVKLEPTMTIFGKVTDIDTGEPVESAKVKVSSSLHEKLVPLSKFTPSVMTALDGTFEMPCVLPGIKGYLVAQHDDYLNPNSLDKPITWTTEKNTFNLQLVPKTISPNTKFPPIVAPDTSGMEPKAAIAKLKAEYKLANDEYSKRIDAKNSVAEQTFALQRLNPNQAYLDAMLKIADANSDPEIEATALAWCCAMLMNSQELDLAGRYRLRTEIGNRIIEKYLDRPEIEDCLDTLIYSQSDGVATARLIVEKNPKHEIQGQCLLLMAESLIQSVDIHRRLKGIGKGNKSEEKVKEKIDDAIDTLVRIKIEYADVPHWRNETLGKMAEMHLDALTKLTPKTTAPEIVGLNQNAEEMKLSDFRGKIVVLEFWEEGISNLAEMNDVAKRHPDDVVMLGVACGPKKSALEAIQKDKVGFQNWIDDGMPGPIARQWNISSFPTTVILDRYGKIRHFNFARIVGAENLRFLVEDILAEESKLPNAMSKLNDSQEPTPDKYAFKPEDYEYDREKGFTVVFKLLIQAEKVNAPAVTIAKLRYDAAKLQRFIALNAGDDEEKDFSKAITILRGVTTNPDKFLVTNESAQFFRNCVGLLTAIYGDKGNSKHEIKTVLESATADIQAAPSLSDHERFMLLSDVRMIASDVALNEEDWPAAIRWVQPIIDDTDKFLNTNEGAHGIAMSVRQQSMFLAKNGDAKASADLIDWMCDKLEAASNIDEATRLQLQCMLRGKHLINLTIDKNPEQASAGWEKYQALAKRARAYQGADRANVLKSCLDDMDRLAIGCIYQSDPEKAISIVRDAMALIEAEPELQLASSRVWWSLEDMTRMVCDMPQNPNPEARNLKTDVTEFIQRVKKEK